MKLQTIAEKFQKISGQKNSRKMLKYSCGKNTTFVLGILIEIND